MVEVKTLVCFDKFTEEQESYFKGKGVKLVPYEAIVQIGM